MKSFKQSEKFMTNLGEITIMNCVYIGESGLALTPIQGIKMETNGYQVMIDTGKSGYESIMTESELNQLLREYKIDEVINGKIARIL